MLIEFVKSSSPFKASVLELSVEEGKCRLMMFSSLSSAANFIGSIIPEDFLPEVIIVCEDVNLASIGLRGDTASKVSRVLSTELTIESENVEYTFSLSDYIDRVDLCKRLDLYPDPEHVCPILRRDLMRALVDDLMYYVMTRRASFQSLFNIMSVLGRERLYQMLLSSNKVMSMIIEDIERNFDLYPYMHTSGFPLKNVILIARDLQAYSRSVARLCRVLDRACSVVLDQLPRRDLRMLRWGSMQAMIIDTLLATLDHLDEHVC